VRGGVNTALICVVTVNLIYNDMGSLRRKHLDLFSGIGGFALAARWMGIETIGFCEIDKYCQKVLKKNFPGVPIYEDVTKLKGDQFKDIFLLTGGFPCQDISIAGKGAGIEGERSGLWTELHRIISEVRPKYALIENVSALTIRGGTRVIGDLTEIGYDTEWQIVGANDVGAPHRRKRIWIVAYPNSKSESDVTINDKQRCRKLGGDVAYSKCNSEGSSHRSNIGIGGRRWDEQSVVEWNEMGGNSGNSSEDVAYSDSGFSKRENKEICTWGNSTTISSEDVAYSDSTGFSEQWRTESIREKQFTTQCGSRWSVEPNVGRVAHGVRSRVDRLRGLGNAIVPQVAYEIMKCLK
tara:strand:+ start:4103 stop:5158 length:1056 start_codon:yes stop_codon:yes gene_type:complete